MSDFSEAKRFLDRATSEYGVGAYASATASAWLVLETCCQALDREHRMHDRAPFASRALRQAREAILESEEFRQSFVKNDPTVIARLHGAHQTPTVCEIQVHPDSTAIDVADQYLNFARRELGVVSSGSLDASRALDLLAAITLADSSLPPSERSKALCFRRAAFQGQPGNVVLAHQLGRQLANAGLFDEAQLALEHSMALSPSAEASETLAAVLATRGESSAAQQYATVAARLPSTRRPADVPEVVALSPQAFAAMSSRPTHPASQHRPLSPVSVLPSRAIPADGNVVGFDPHAMEASRPAPAQATVAAPRVAYQPAPMRPTHLPATVSPFNPAPNRPETDASSVEYPSYANENRASGTNASPVRRVLDSIGRLW